MPGNRVYLLLRVPMACHIEVHMRWAHGCRSSMCMACDRTREAVRDGDGLWQASIALRQLYRYGVTRRAVALYGVSYPCLGPLVARCCSAAAPVAVPKRGDLVCSRLEPKSTSKTTTMLHPSKRSPKSPNTANNFHHPSSRYSFISQQ